MPHWLAIRLLNVVTPIAAALALVGPLWAADLHPKLCPPVVHTCYVGYVTPTGKFLVLLSSIDNDPLVSQEIEVLSSEPGAGASKLDLSKQIGSIVMLDAQSDQGIYAAKITSIADPILTALYMATFLKVPPDEQQQ